MSLNGDLYNQMPISYPFSYRSAPMIYDIDGDDDLEIIAGTSLSINAIDIKQSGSTDGYWSMYKGNYQRTGYNQFTPLCDSGDINEDGVINILDVVLMVTVVLNGLP